MPQPNAAWQKKYGKSKEKKHLLNGQDTILTAVKKLACGNVEAEGIVLQMLKHDAMPIMRLFDMDDMQLHGEKIMKAYHEWAGNDYKKLLFGLFSRDGSLIKFIEN